MRIELKGKVHCLTKSKYVGSNGMEIYEIVVRKFYTDQENELKFNQYAFQVFPQKNKNEREQLEYYIGKNVTVKGFLKATEWEKDGKVSYITNLNFNSIELLVNAYKKPEESKTEIPREKINESNQEFKEEVLPVVDEPPFVETNQDDLPF